jgi:hypothetical protein
MKPEEIFRFVNTRPVQRASEDRVTRGFAAYDKQAKSPLHREIEQLQGPDAREKAIDLARKVLAANGQMDNNLLILLDAVQAALSKKKVEESRKAAEKVLGNQLAAYLSSDLARQLKDKLWDQMYAHTLAPEEQPEQRDSVYEGVRAFHYLEWLVKQKEDATPFNQMQFSAITPTIPKALLPVAPEGDHSWEELYRAQVLADLNTVHTRVSSLNAAIKDLDNGDRVFKAQELRSTVDLSHVEIKEVQSLRTMTLTAPMIQFPEGVINGNGKAGEPEIPGAVVPALLVDHTVITVPKKIPWIYEEFGQKTLSGTTLELLGERKANLVELENAEMVAALEQEKYDLVAGFFKKLHPFAIAFVRENGQFKDLVQAVAIPGFQIAPAMEASPAPGSAAARGIEVLGIGDLLVVKQELMHYAAGEVAHIENIMKSEFMTRSNTRTREVEEIIITETEQLEENERDLQTTERFELQKETEKTIQEQMSLQAGVSVTASYGPVSMTAHADFALTQSSTEANRNASNFAKEVTERSVARIKKRTREERTRRTLERFEEKNEHGFDNKSGSDHVIGIYHWVDKYYKARLINYGRRLMLEFIIPEPSAFYMHVQSNQPIKGVSLEKPQMPMMYGRKLEPTDLSKWNYTNYVAKYNVEDVEAYPAEVVRVSAAYAESAQGNENVAFGKTAEKLSVPSGYKCFDVFGELGYQGIKDSGYFLECFVAGQRWGSVTAKGVEGIIPISIKGWATAFHVNVVAICELKPETKAAWQQKTYAAIITAYEKALSDYEAAVSSAQIQAGVEIQGRNPAFNRKIEQDELKKGVLRELTNNFAKTRVGGVWRFDEIFDAMQDNGEFGYPEFNMKEALVEGRIVQFFEQALEWDNMTYRFYPYIWGRKDKWKDLFARTDVDPLFTDFMRAGAARVLVPAHPAYTDTVLHYMATNEIWNGGNPPTLDDPLYISIVDEMKADAGGDLDAGLPVCAPDSPYPCLADEWEVKLPTTLVYLQPDSKLPDAMP